MKLISVHAGLIICSAVFGSMWLVVAAGGGNWGAGFVEVLRVQQLENISAVKE